MNSDFSLNDEIQKIKIDIQQAMQQYVTEAYQFVIEQMPWNEATMRESTSYELLKMNDDEIEYIIYTDDKRAPYAGYQKDTVLNHLFHNDRYQSIGETDNATRVQNNLAKIRSLNNKQSKAARELRSNKADYNYQLNLKLLKGWQPRASWLRGLKMPMGNLVEVRADWLDRKKIEKGVGTLKGFIKEELKWKTV